MVVFIFAFVDDILICVGWFLSVHVGGVVVRVNTHYCLSLLVGFACDFIFSHGINEGFVCLKTFGTV